MCGADDMVAAAMESSRLQAPAVSVWARLPQEGDGQEARGASPSAFLESTWVSVGERNELTHVNCSNHAWHLALSLLLFM